MVEWVDDHANGNDMYCDTTLFFFFVRWSERLENNTRCEQLVVCKKIKQWHLGEGVDKKSGRERVE